MTYTTVDLYRNGNASSARMDHVRTNLSNAINFDIFAAMDAHGQVWVDVNAGGISTQEIPDRVWSKVWKLPAGASVPAGLNVWNDSARPLDMGPVFAEAPA